MPTRPPDLDRLLKVDPYLNDHVGEIERRYGEFQVRLVLQNSREMHNLHFPNLQTIPGAPQTH